MSKPPAAEPLGREATIIPAGGNGVTALRTHAFLAIIAALGLRLLFVLRFPGSAGDSDLYLQLARNWTDHHVYGLWLNGYLVPTDLRTPGYPALLAGVALILGRSLRAIMLSQAVVDVLTCFLTAALAAALAPAGLRRRSWIIALWLAATCPFLANYTAVVLTESLVTFLATAAVCCFALALRTPFPALTLLDEHRHATPFALALLGALLAGLATLVRPEMPLILVVAAPALVIRGWKIPGARKMIFAVAAMGAAFLIPLLPWAGRNLVTLKKVQFIAPRYANLPGEYAPVGYYAWTATWLERYRDAYLSLWKIGEEPVDINDLPPSAFDSPAEKARITDLFCEYNDSAELDISLEMDRQFAEIAREKTRRHPLRTYVGVPLQRALSIWFTPRTELMDIDGKLWPLRQQWEDSHANVLITGSFAVLGYLYVGLAIGGVWLAWRYGVARGASGSSDASNFWGIGFLLAYLLVRTVFLTTVEAPEPRYVLSCYPVVLAFIALIGIPRGDSGAKESL
jgi:hypothetical protein